MCCSQPISDIERYYWLLSKQKKKIFGKNIMNVTQIKILYKNLQTLQGYIFQTFQHFTTKLCNFTNVTMLFLALVTVYSSRLKLIVLCKLPIPSFSKKATLFPGPFLKCQLLVCHLLVCFLTQLIFSYPHIWFEKKLRVKLPKFNAI